MNCLLLYYTGTFNTRFVTGKLKTRLETEGWSVTSYEIDPLNNESLDLSSYDIIGLGYPIYGYCAPYAFLRFVRAQKFPRGMRIFIYKNSGETEHANDASSKYLVRKLRRDVARGGCDHRDYCMARMYSDKMICCHNCNDIPQKLWNEIDKIK